MSTHLTAPATDFWPLTIDYSGAPVNVDASRISSDMRVPTSADDTSPDDDHPAAVAASLFCDALVAGALVPPDGITIHCYGTDDHDASILSPGRVHAGQPPPGRHVRLARRRHHRAPQPARSSVGEPPGPRSRGTAVLRRRAELRARRPGGEEVVMSVIYYSDHELEGLWGRLGGGDQLREALVALGTANRAAYMATYRDCESVEPVAISTPRPDASAVVARWTCTDWAQNLLYNCISNDGREFADPADTEVLLAAAARQDAAMMLADVTGDAPEPAFNLVYEWIALRENTLREAIASRRLVLQRAGYDPAADMQLSFHEHDIEHLARLRAGLDDLCLHESKESA